MMEAERSGMSQVVAGSRRRSWGRAAAVTLLVLALVGTAVLAGYLWRTTRAWQADAARLEALVTDVETRRAELAAELDQMRRDLAASDEQLRRAQDRITALAEEKALTADERESARLLAATAAQVATQLEACVRGQEQLITALGDAEAYDPQSVLDYAQTVREACNRALEGNAEIQRIVGQG